MSKQFAKYLSARIMGHPYYITPEWLREELQDRFPSYSMKWKLDRMMRHKQFVYDVACGPVFRDFQAIASAE